MIQWAIKYNGGKLRQQMNSTPVLFPTKKAAESEIETLKIGNCKPVKVEIKEVNPEIIKWADKMSRKTKSNELERFVRHFLCCSDNLKNGVIGFNRFSTDGNIQVVLDALIKCDKDGDCPDGFYYEESSDTLFIFEHFEFDCSSNKKNGSMLRKNIAHTESAARQELNQATGEYKGVKVIEQSEGIRDGDTITYRVGADGDKFRDNYIANFKKAFERHAKKVSDYISNCKKKTGKDCKSIKVCFVFEDITLGGTHYKIDKNSMGGEVNILLTKQFMDIFRDSPVDYAIFGMMQNPSTLTVCDKTVLAFYDKADVVDLSKEEFFVFPSMPRFTYAVKRNL
ncbi:MAG: hypothetical protein FWD58_01750 [Firmicutes bacterium]|nr:hypothetical protein [Bacillota bacterium]